MSQTLPDHAFIYKGSEYRWNSFTFSGAKHVTVYKRVPYELAVEPLSREHPLTVAVKMWIESPYHDTMRLDEFLKKLRPSDG